MTVWTYPGATLAQLVDGDSFYADLQRGFDFGFHVTLIGQAREKFRLNRCNAAPLKSPSGDGAAARLAELLTGTFQIQSVGPYKYGDEWMAEVILPDGRNVSDVMIAEQWAAPWDGRGSQPLPPWPRVASMVASHA